MTLTDQVIRNIVARVIKSRDYRIEIVNLINAEFLQFAVDFSNRLFLQSSIQKISLLSGIKEYL